MSNLGQNLSQCWNMIQTFLFPFMEEELDPLTKKQQKFISILEIARIESYIPPSHWNGRPPKHRIAIARAFIGKNVYNIDTTTMLIERLKSDKNFRRICGFETVGQIPSEATFSRAFSEFADYQLPQRVHEALIKEECKEDVILHSSSDSTPIIGREKPKINTDKKLKDKKIIKKRGRPKKGEKRKNEEKYNRLDKQPLMAFKEMLQDLPNHCDIGCKKNSQGFLEKWIGFKLHISTADGGIPISAILTSASVHDSQVAIPLMSLTAQRVINLYDIYDAAYYDKRIEDYSKSLNHVPIIDVNPRANKSLKIELESEAKARKTLNLKMPKDQRYNERTTAERTNARLKDEFGGRNIRVKGGHKVMCHLMFGILALTIDQLLRIVV